MSTMSCKGQPTRRKTTCRRAQIGKAELLISLYKIFVPFTACVDESIFLLLPPPTCIAYTIAILLQCYCAIYDPPPTPLVYAIHHAILVMAISCEGQAPAHTRGMDTVIDSSNSPTRRIQNKTKGGVRINPG